MHTLFTEQAELCKRANTETTIFPVRKTSDSFKNLKRLLHRTNIEDALALLLTKVGSEFLVLMNLTSRDNLNNGAVLDKFSNSLNNYQGRYADWEKSENLREIREKQEQLLRESLLSDQKIRTTRQQRMRDCKSNTRLFNRGAKFQTREEARSIFGNIVDADDVDVDADADPASLLLEKEADAARREEKEGEKGDEERPEDEKEKAVVVIQQLFRRYLAKRILQKDAENGKTMKHEDRVEIHSVLDVKKMV
ncbi:unnamed protein product [Porites lobata]|uniref:Uncharacterized protein n=1 Tax=Porites lobata TaxID=104759 RepID=A0ABN8NA76_9CNID|nr:unnamed protein product [Porites lobata]